MHKKTFVCPFCELKRTNLKTHVRIVHNLDAENARAVKIQTGQLRQRQYKEVREKNVQEKTGCSKTVVRLDNHLRQTQDYGSKRFSTTLEVCCYSQTESECSQESDESEDEYEVFIKMLKRDGAKYLKRLKPETIYSEDSSDED